MDMERKIKRKPKMKAYTALVDMNCSLELRCRARTKGEARKIFFAQFLKKVRLKHMDLCIDRDDI